jgi:PHD/YefM family antitoxin component YafN of YafNO toxin-antitoxin module
LITQIAHILKSHLQRHAKINPKKFSEKIFFVEKAYNIMYNYKGKAKMKTMTLSNARKNLFQLKSEITESQNPIILTHKSGNVIMISEDDYWNLIEHLHIMKDSITMDALKDAIEERKNKKRKGNYKTAEDLLNELEI